MKEVVGEKKRNFKKSILWMVYRMDGYGGFENGSSTFYKKKKAM